MNDYVPVNTVDAHIRVRAAEPVGLGARVETKWASPGDHALG
jgi:hypothetical protein